jgi:type IV fimbrial biogenesis protein FimT
MIKVMRSSVVHLQRGLTIIEVVVVIAIATILIGIAVPSFKSQITASQRKSATVDFLIGMAYARSESVKQGKNVYLRSLSGTQSWTGGWCVTTQADCRGEVLRQFNVPIKVIIKSSASTVTAFSFNPQGFLASASDSLSFCSGEASKKVVVTPIGQALLKTCSCNEQSQCI